MSRILLVASCLLGCAGPVVAQAVVPIDVHSAYLHVDTADFANPALAIDLGALGLAPGYTIGLECAGAWDPGPGGDDQTNLLGVFSDSATLLDRSLLHRVPGAIDAGLDNNSGSTWPSGEPTDIAEDFLIGRPGIAIVIPAGATHLFVTPADIYYTDNSDPDGDLGVTITLISTTAVAPASPGLPSLALSARPNPTGGEASIAFRLAAAATVRLTIHDVTGRLVRTLIAGGMEPGSHLARWDGSDSDGRRVPSGSYFARLAGGACERTTRISLLR
jgi:hypothetical protein